MDGAFGSLIIREWVQCVRWDGDEGEARVLQGTRTEDDASVRGSGPPAVLQIHPDKDDMGRVLINGER